MITLYIKATYMQFSFWAYLHMPNTKNPTEYTCRVYSYIRSVCETWGLLQLGIVLHLCMHAVSRNCVIYEGGGGGEIIKSYIQ